MAALPEVEHTPFGPRRIEALTLKPPTLREKLYRAAYDFAQDLWPQYRVGLIDIGLAVVIGKIITTL